MLSQMIVVVDGAAGSVALDGASNLRGLSVELRSCSPADADRLLGDLGRLDGGHVWLTIERLRALSPLAGDPAWAAGFDGAMTYAGTQGWIDDTGSRVRAHLASPA